MNNTSHPAKTWEMPDGIYTALVTPFKEGEVDKEAWRKLVRRQLACGVAGLVPVGCTGEAATLTRPEREWLVRTAVGPFRLEDAVSVETLVREAQEDCWGGRLLSMFEALSHLPHVVVDEDRVERLRHGQAVAVEAPEAAALCCAYDRHKGLVAILHPGTEPNLWQPRKVFVT